MDPPLTYARKPHISLPRPRGDGPWRGWLGRSDSASPPPTRGWTLRCCHARPVLTVSPAHAGMDPHRFRRNAPHDGLPRPRGDGPSRIATTRELASSPPPTRGWTRGNATGRGIRDVSPAHAGMDPDRYEALPILACLPRPRGDGPGSAYDMLAVATSPPPTRGCTHRLKRLRPVAWVSPAHAGMDPGTASRPRAFRCLPRPRGDGPPPRIRRTLRALSPPRTRGWTLHSDCDHLSSLVSPPARGRTLSSP